MKDVKRRPFEDRSWLKELIPIFLIETTARDKAIEHQSAIAFRISRIGNMFGTKHCKQTAGGVSVLLVES